MGASQPQSRPRKGTGALTEHLERLPVPALQPVVAHLRPVRVRVEIMGLTVIRSG
eukprot:COSAG01_NODE_1476_length_10188_cov_16.029537_12_plen_55_part_00